MREEAPWKNNPGKARGCNDKVFDGELRVDEKSRVLFLSVGSHGSVL